VSAHWPYLDTHLRSAGRHRFRNAVHSRHDRRVHTRAGARFAVCEKKPGMRPGFFVCAKDASQLRPGLPRLSTVLPWMTAAVLLPTTYKAVTAFRSDGRTICSSHAALRAGAKSDDRVMMACRLWESAKRRCCVRAASATVR
jgi:hypothetical protein